MLSLMTVCSPSAEPSVCYVGFRGAASSKYVAGTKDRVRGSCHYFEVKLGHMLLCVSKNFAPVANLIVPGRY